MSDRVPSSTTPDEVRARLRSWVEVDLGALERNATRLVERAQRPMIAMVKADGYGHGTLPVVRALLHWAQHNTARVRHPLFGFGTATLEESLTLREHVEPSVARIVCCAPLLADELADAHAASVVPALHTIESIARWAALGGGEWHLSIDTGMQRAGVRWTQVAQLRDIIASNPPAGVFTHFHSSEQDNGSREVQEARFEDACRTLNIAQLPGRVLRHVGNSGAIAAGASSPYDLVRPGLSLYGGFATDALPVEPVATVRARVVDIHDLDAGDSVSYGATWRASNACRVATVGVGYGDGYRQQLSNRAHALLHGRPVPVVGKVTMDMTMLDVTDIPCAIGDIVTLLGRDGDAAIRPEELAAAGGLSVYELFVGLRLRMPRLYLNASPARRHAQS